MALEHPLEDITRSKKKFKLSQEEFFSGAWLAELQKSTSFDKVDIIYKGGYLIANFYKKRTTEVRKNE
jgi:hypothetical protein